MASPVAVSSGRGSVSPAAASYLGRLASAGTLAQSQWQSQALVKRQERVNNFLMLLSCSNYLRNRKLSNDVAVVQRDVAAGKEAVAALGTHVATVQRSIATVESSLTAVARDVEHTAEEVEDLKQSVTARAGQVDAVLQSYEEQLQQQRALLENQDQSIQRLMGSKLRHDATVDVAIWLVSAFFANSTLVDLPLRLLTSSLLIVPGSTAKAWAGRVTAALRFAVFLLLVRTTRTYAQQLGLHSNIGTASTYRQVLSAAAKSLWQRALVRAGLQQQQQQQPRSASTSSTAQRAAPVQAGTSTTQQSAPARHALQAPGVASAALVARRRSDSPHYHDL